MLPDPSTLVPLMVLMFVPDTSVSCADKADLAPGAVLEPVPPFATGRVPVTPVVRGRPVAFVSVTDVGVPRIGVTNVGLVDNTFAPEPVLVVTPVPPLATGNVPVTPVVRGRPVAFVSVPEVGVPKIGVTSVGLVDRTFAPEPVLVVTPVPPLATGKVPVTLVAKFTKVVDVVPVPPEAMGSAVPRVSEFNQLS